MSSSTEQELRPVRSVVATLGGRVRQLRGQLQLSVRALAQRTDFSPSFISQLEKGTVSPSLGSLEKIAEALGATLRDLFVEAADGQPLILRRGERQHVTSSWSRARIETLSVADQKLTAILIVLEPGGRSGKHPRAQVREEFALVIAGQVVLRLGEKQHILRQGDSVVVPAGTPRLLTNASTRKARVLIVSSP